MIPFVRLPDDAFPKPEPTPDTVAALERIRAARRNYYAASARVLAKSLGETHPTTLQALVSLDIAEQS